MSVTTDYSLRILHQAVLTRDKNWLILKHCQKFKHQTEDISLDRKLPTYHCWCWWSLLLQSVWSHQSESHATVNSHHFFITTTTWSFLHFFWWPAVVVRHSLQSLQLTTHKTYSRLLQTTSPLNNLLKIWIAFK